MAITAWSAKVSRSSICLSVKGPGCERATVIDADGEAVAQHRDGHRSDGSEAHARAMPMRR